MKFTILGGSGFIGAALARSLRERGTACETPARGDRSIYQKPLGHLIYAAGLTADFRKRPFDTVRAHVCGLLEVLERAAFDSFLYLSSTRVYLKAGEGTETARPTVDPADPEDLYNLSKLMGESVCFSVKRSHVRVVRLSNVYGNDPSSGDFIGSLVRAAADKGLIRFTQGPGTEKDYISINDVVDLLPRIAAEGRHRLYNIAGGQNVSNREIAKVLQEATGCGVEFTPDSADLIFPTISIARVQALCPFSPAPLLPALRQRAADYRKKRGKR